MSKKSISDTDTKLKNTKILQIINDLPNTSNCLITEKFIGVASPLPATVEDKSDNLYDF